MRLFPSGFVARRCVMPAMRPPRASPDGKIHHFYLSRYLRVTTLAISRTTRELSQLVDILSCVLVSKSLESWRSCN